jgi:hypothetical protein
VLVIFCAHVAQRHWLGDGKRRMGFYTIVFNYSIHAVKKLNDGDLIKIIKWHIFVTININFLFHLSFYLFIDIYYDKSESFNYFN